MTEQNLFQIYKITDQHDDTIYIGISKNFRQRSFYHDLAVRTPDKNYVDKRTGKLKFPHKTYLYNKLRSIIEKCPDYVVLDHIIPMITVSTYEELKQVEISYIKECRQLGIKLCNLTDGGDGTVGYVRNFTEEWKINLSKAKNKYFEDGGKNSFAGRHHSDESIKKIIKTRKDNIAAGRIDDNTKRKGKTNVELYGEDKALKISKRISEQRTGKLKGLKKSDVWEQNRVKAMQGKTKQNTKYSITKGAVVIIWKQSLYEFARSIKMQNEEKSITKRRGDRFYAALKYGRTTRCGYSFEKINY